MTTSNKYQNGVEKTCRNGLNIYFCRNNREEILIRLSDFIDYFAIFGWNYDQNLFNDKVNQSIENDDFRTISDGDIETHGFYCSNALIMHFFTTLLNPS